MRIWLKERREKLNLTQEDVAKASGIKRTYYTMIENGTRTPSVEVTKKNTQVVDFDWTIFLNTNVAI